ncbi:MAG: hypothetical protein AB8G05_05510 [Oligoflexales bacterium]
MNQADKFLLVIEKNSAPIQIIYYYEYININKMQQFRVERAEHSSCFKLYLNANNVIYKEQSEKDRFEWFDEKYLFASSFDLYDKACELELPKVFLDWMAARL